MNIIKIGIFTIVMLLYLWFPFNMIRHTEKILNQGIIHRFRLEPIDPYDAFRGRYVVLFYGNTAVPAMDSLSSGQPIFITLAKDSSGYSFFEAAWAVKPERKDYIITEASYFASASDTVHFVLPENMQYYYMNEKTAPLVDELLWQPIDTIPHKNTVSVRVLKGETAVEELYVDDLPVLEYLKQLQSKQKNAK